MEGYVRDIDYTRMYDNWEGASFAWSMAFFGLTCFMTFNPLVWLFLNLIGIFLLPVNTVKLIWVVIGPILWGADPLLWIPLPDAVLVEAA